MNPASLGRRGQRRALIAAAAIAIAWGTGVVQAADVQINLPPSGNFVIKDNAGTTTLLQLQSTGPLTIPELAIGPRFTHGVCFSPQGELGRCTSVLVGPKNMTLSSPGFTPLASWSVPQGQAVGGYITYTIVATDGGSQLATETGTILFNATANSITCTAPVAQKLHLGTVNSGCTPGFFNPGSQPGVSIFDNVSFSSPAPVAVHYVHFQVHTIGSPVMRFEP